MSIALFSGPCPVDVVNPTLAQRHYLGAARRGFAWQDHAGCLVLAKPTSRRLPADGTWLELSRWCLTGEPNAGSAQWSRVRRWLVTSRSEVTTVVSYSDPGVGHTGALYRAAGWRWAPTWHRLRPPPTGNGRWASDVESVKDRWVDPIRADARRAELLAVRDASLTRRFPWASWTEPRADRGGLCRRGTGGADYSQWARRAATDSRDTGTARGGS